MPTLTRIAGLVEGWCVPMPDSPLTDDRGGDPHHVLLVTKLQRPRPTVKAIARPRLEERMLRALTQGTFCFLIAPAGFGKSTLVSQVVGSGSYPAAWVHLDANDNDPTLFWSYVVAALRHIQPDLLPSLNIPQLHPSDPWLTAVVRELSAITEPFILVLNDFHHITATAILDRLLILLAHPPPALRLILTSRTDPLLNRTRLTITHQIDTFTLNDLRFTPEEALAFFRETMGWAVGAEIAHRLVKRTEGWPAALQIAALRLHDHPDVSELVQRFDGGNHAVMRYLDEEVFNPLPAHLRDFLLFTSPLEALIPALCNAVTGRSDSEELLEQLVRAQLFLVPLNDQGAYYRYHTLFSDYLRSRLLRDYPDRVAQIHQLAASHYLAHNLIDPAVEHLFAADDLTAMERLIRVHARSRLVGGALDTLWQWIERLPPAWVERAARLLVYRAWVLLLRGQLDRIEGQLGQAERVLMADPDQLLPQDGRTLPGEIAALRAQVAHLTGDFAASFHHAHMALHLLPPDNVLTRGLALLNLGYTAWLTGDLPAAGHVFSQDMLSITGDEAEQAVVQLLARCNLANLCLTQGRLHEGYELYNAVLAASTDRDPLLQVVTGIAQVGIGTVLYAWNQLERAALYTRQGLEMAQPWLYISALLPGYLLLAQIEQARRQEAATHQALRAYETHIETAHLTLLRQVVRAQRARLALMRGDVAVALGWARRSQLHPDGEMHFATMGLYLVYAEALVAGGQAARVLSLLARVAQTAREHDWGWLWLESCLVRTVALWQAGRQEEAIGEIYTVLQAAEPEGYIRLFVDRGAPVERILRRLDEARDPLSYTGEILRAFEDESQRVTQIAFVSQPHMVKSISGLTPRELEVLQLMAEGKSNQAIGDLLVISEQTAKTHVGRILRKLEVENRTEAVARARKLGLIQG